MVTKMKFTFLKLVPISHSADHLYQIYLKVPFSIFAVRSKEFFNRIIGGECP